MAKRPRDPNQLAKFVVDMVTADKADSPESPQSDITDAKKFARLGGLRGGKARAEKLTPGERSKIAADAARARWDRRRQRDD